MQKVSPRTPGAGESDRLALVYGIDVSSDEIRSRALEWFRKDSRHPKNARSKPELIRVELDVSLGDQLRPLECRLSGEKRSAALGNFSVVIGETSVYIFCRCEYENSIAAHVLEQIDRAFDVCKKNF